MTLLSGNDVKKNCSGSIAESDLQRLEIKGQTSDDHRPCICSIRSTSSSSKAVLHVNKDRYFLAQGKAHDSEEIFGSDAQSRCVLQPTAQSSYHPYNTTFVYFLFRALSAKMSLIRGSVLRTTVSEFRMVLFVTVKHHHSCEMTNCYVHNNRHNKNCVPHMLQEAH